MNLLSVPPLKTINPSHMSPSRSFVDLLDLLRGHAKLGLWIRYLLVSTRLPRRVFNMHPQQYPVFNGGENQNYHVTAIVKRPRRRNNRTLKSVETPSYPQPSSAMHSRNCPEILNHGICNIQRCPHNHSIPTCEPCKLLFNAQGDYQYHLATIEHLTQTTSTSNVNYCSTCQTNVAGGKAEWMDHLHGHNQASNPGVSQNVQPQTAASANDTLFCGLCEIAVESKLWKVHLGCAKHVSRLTFIRYKEAVAEAEADKHGIAMEGVFDFDCIAPHDAKRSVKNSITIRATRQCILLEFKLSSSHGETSTNGFQVAIESGSPTLSASNSCTLGVTFKQAYLGRYEDRLELIFQDTHLRQPFIITRTLRAVVGDKALFHELAPKSPYIPPKPNAKKKEIGEVVGGVKHSAPKAIGYKGKLPEAAIPKPLKELLNSSEPIVQITKKIKEVYLPEPLTKVTYGKFFRHLLWIEEMKMEQDLIKYDMTDVVLTRHNKFYFLHVPGLADKRPGILFGDSILVQEQNSSNDKWFQGVVNSIHKTEVRLSFSDSFDQFNEGKVLHIRFKPSRLPVLRQHQALDMLFVEDRILFPEVAHLPLGRTKSNAAARLDWFNPLIANNEPQIQAIVSILSLPAGSPPFIVFGPPGTGKTLTIVEAIQQLLYWNPSTKILACAPSNSAADLIASRLTTRLSPKDLFRFYAPSRSKDSIPDELQEYAYTDLNGAFSIPSSPTQKAALGSFRVVVTTCQSGSIAHGVGMPRGSFTHIFIDEAGQATEPEALLAVRTMADARTNVVVSGDPRQLGPIIRSGIAMGLGLGYSYLERLMSRDLYNLKLPNKKSVIKLTKNFRSHQSILAFPNSKFYNGDLEQCADPSTINCFLNTSFLPSKQFPVVFHGVLGKNDRESGSPSFFNIDEIMVVRWYVEKLMGHRKFPAVEEDIGIISPYHAQCSRLKANLGAMDGLKIGSVEEFQGQERKVIIISTVRSSQDFVEYDLRHTLGFVANPRRFNVAITRAQALLIIVGDPNVLSLDPLWRSFLNYVYLNGGWKGSGITWDPNEPVNEAGGYDRSVRAAAGVEMEEFLKRMGRLGRAGDGDNYID